MRSSITLCFALHLLACGSADDPESETPTPTAELVPAPEPEAPEDVETGYSIHEWGFVAHHYAAGDDELLTSGTAPTPSRRTVPPPSIGIGGLGLRGGKPILYVHLEGEGNIARFTASLSTAGRFMEEWPHSADSTTTTLSWEVEARRGSCSARNRYPVAADRHCQGIPDRYCEAAELANYETQDGACLTVDENEWNHLFYRAEMPGPLPVRVTKRRDEFHVSVTAELPGRLMRIRRSPDAVDTRVALFDAPAAGEPLALPTDPDQPAAAGVAALQAELIALGMSEDEIEAFMTAWQAELFGDTAERQQVPMVGQPPHDLRPKDDALIYFIPTATLDVMVPLSFTPPPTEVHRAVLVRVDLGEAHVEPVPTTH